MSGRIDPELMKQAKRNLLDHGQTPDQLAMTDEEVKNAFVPMGAQGATAPPPMPPGMDPMAMMMGAAGGGMPPAGGAPPMDPSMMGGAAPPMDPSMMGGAPPMDPSMMGAPPPADPAAAGAAPPAEPPPPPATSDEIRGIIQEELQNALGSLMTPADEQLEQDRPLKLEAIQAQLDDMAGKVDELMENLGGGMPPEAGMPPEGEMMPEPMGMGSDADIPPEMMQAVMGGGAGPLPATGDAMAGGILGGGGLPPQPGGLPGGGGMQVQASAARRLGSLAAQMHRQAGD
jgi:hypothetical protein